MQSLPLGQSMLSFPTKRQARAKLRHQYELRAEEAQERYVEHFATYATLDQAMEDFPVQLGRVLDEGSAAVASDLVSAGIFDWDDVAVRKELEGRLEGLMATFTELEEAYASIGAQAVNREYARASSGQDRAYLAGGGFGVEGAAKGVAVATAANAALSLVYGAADAAGRAIADRADAKKKRLLFEEPHTRLTLAKVIRDVVFEGQAVLAQVLNQAREGGQVEEISPEAERRASALTNNVAQGRIAPDQIRDILTQAIELDPYAAKPWLLWIEMIGDPDGSVLKSSEAIGILGLTAHRDALLDRDRQALAWATPEECLKSCDTLEARARALGIAFDAEKAQIRARAQQLDEARRTFNGTLYATQAEAVAARQASEDEAKRTIAGVTYASHEEAAAAKAQWRDEQARTFRDTQYATPMAAQAVRWRHHRATSLAIWVGVLLAPFPTAFLTLRSGYSSRQRIVAFVWLCVLVGLMTLGGALRSGVTAGPLVVVAVIVSALAWLASLIEIRVRIAFLDWIRSSPERQGDASASPSPAVTPS